MESYVFHTRFLLNILLNLPKEFLAYLILKNAVNAKQTALTIQFDQQAITIPYIFTAKGLQLHFLTFYQTAKIKINNSIRNFCFCFHGRVLILNRINGKKNLYCAMLSQILVGSYGML